jgi:4'-phosphopantetheinyl transferase
MIEIRPGVFQHPVVHLDGGGARRQVSITDSEPWGAALAFPEEHPMAIDVERVQARDVLASLCVPTAHEGPRLAACALAEPQRHSIAWTAKEALSKVLKTGLTLDFKILEISALHPHARHLECLFANFPQYRAVSWLLQDFAWSIVLPRKSDLDADAAVAALSAEFGV